MKFLLKLKIPFKSYARAYIKYIQGIWKKDLFYKM